MLHELAATQMEHELREDRELGREAERVGVVGTVLRELRAEPNQRAIDPAQNVRHGLSLSASRRSYLLQQALRGQSRDNHSGALLIERGGHGLHVREVHVPASADGGHAAAQPAVGVRVRGHQLQAATAVLNGRLLAVAHFEVERQRRRGVDAAQIPRVRAALCLSILSFIATSPISSSPTQGPAFLSDMHGPMHPLTLNSFVVCSSIVAPNPIISDPASTPHFPRETPTALAVLVRIHLEHVAERAPEHGLAEEVAQQAQSAGGFDARPHLQKTDLVEAAREEIHGLVVLAAALRDALVELLRLLEIGRLVVLDIDVGADGFFEAGAHDAAGTRRAGTAHEEHQMSRRLRTGDLQQRGRHGQSAAGAAFCAVLRAHGPLRDEKSGEKQRDPSPTR